MHHICIYIYICIIKQKHKQDTVVDKLFHLTKVLGKKCLSPKLASTHPTWRYLWSVTVAICAMDNTGKPADHNLWLIEPETSYDMVLVLCSSLYIGCKWYWTPMTKMWTEQVRHAVDVWRWPFWLSFRGSLCDVINKIMFQLTWQTVFALKRMLICLFPNFWVLFDGVLYPFLDYIKRMSP